MGRHVARMLNYAFIDMDEEIVKTINGISIRQYIDNNGWKAFRSLECDIFRKVVAETSSLTKHVLISCGGGCIETEEIRTELCQQPYVVYINRDLTDLEVDYYKSESNYRPPLELSQKLQERQVYYYQCSKYEFTMLKNDNDWKTHTANLSHFLRRMVGSQVRLPLSDDSYFISLTYKNLLNVDKDQFICVTRGCEAVELRVDLLESHEKDFIAKQIAYIRKYTTLPIIYTVRSSKSFGVFDNNETAIFDLLTFGIRCGCEFIDLEANFHAAAKRHWLKTITGKHVNIIASIHVRLSDFDIEQTIDQCCMGSGVVQVVKIVLDMDEAAAAIENVLATFQRCRQLLKQRNQSNVILLAMGARGKLSRVLNRFMTPVTHELLPTPAAPGQLSARQIQEARRALGLDEPKHYYLFGSPIRQSLSPCMFRTAFDHFHLPHTYELCETSDVSLLQDVMRQPNFGGGSVTIPLKQDVFAMMLQDATHQLSDAAKRIGAVNTVQKRDDGTIHADNTDWIAIHRLVAEKMSAPGSALIIGAGGTACAALYAMSRLNDVQLIYLYNPRTPDKATQLADAYNSPRILPVTRDAVNSLQDVHVVINTLPAAINFTLDDAFFESAASPEHCSILYDVNYVPYQTALIKQAQQHNWTVVYGIDMLIEQGLEQFRIWTGKVGAVAPIVKGSVRQAYDSIINRNE